MALFYRYQVWDDLGPLRSFPDLPTARNFCIDGMRLVVLPKPKPLTCADLFQIALENAGESLF